MTARLAHLPSDRRGVTAVEFGIIAPVMCLLLAGAFDMAHSLYMTSVLQGIVQKTARDGSLESGTAATQQQKLDNRVREQVLALANKATVTVDRRFYRTFSDAAAAKEEKYTDTDKDGLCDNGEPYTDTNNNNVWDADGGDEGEGGAKDRVVYTVTVSYHRLLPIYSFVGLGDTQTITARTVLQNQPYSNQGSYAPAGTDKHCTS